MRQRLLIGNILLCITFWLGLVSQVHAHGAVVEPIARQYYCYKQGDFWSDPNNISNPGCRAAYDKSGTYPFQQWNEISKNVTPLNDQAAIERAVPNGKLCSAGENNKVGLDVPNLRDGQKQPSLQVAISS